jgi:hypothetical protein
MGVDYHRRAHEAGEGMRNLTTVAASLLVLFLSLAGRGVSIARA